MGMKKYALILILITGHSPAHSQDSLTLDQALSIALDNNFGIRLSKKQTEISGNRIHIGNAGMLPKLDAQAGVNYTHNNTKTEYHVPLDPVDEKGSPSTSYNASVGLTYTLWDGLGMFRNFKRLKEIRNVSDAQTRINIENTLVQVVAAFYHVARASINQKLASETLDISRERLKRIEYRLESGAGGSIDLLNARVDFNADSVLLLQAKAAVENARQQLQFLLGNEMDFSMPVAAVTRPGQVSTDGLLETAVENNIAVQLAKINLNVSQLDVQLIRAFRSPRLTANAAYSYSEQRADAGFISKSSNTGFSGGLTVVMNLFDGYKTNINAQNARIGMQSQTIALEQAEATVTRDLGIALTNYENTLTIFSLEKSNLATAMQNFNRSKELFDLGQITSTQFREAQLNLTRSKFRLTDARFEVKLAETEILRVSGGLVQN